MTCTGQWTLPSGGRLPSANAWQRCKAATNPARTSDDLPLPEAVHYGQ